MKTLYMPLLVILYMVPGMVIAADPIDEVAALIKQGNAYQLATLFAPSVEFTLGEEENVYSKAQAEQILDKFFKDNRPRSISMLHKVNSNTNFRFGVLILTTDKGKFRIAYTLKGTGDALSLIELRIETEKMK
jgi:hypothetical protein